MNKKKSIVQKQYVPCINQMGTGKMHQKKIVHIQRENDRIAESHNCIENVHCAVLFALSLYSSVARRPSEGMAKAAKVLVSIEIYEMHEKWDLQQKWAPFIIFVRFVEAILHKNTTCSQLFDAQQRDIMLCPCQQYFPN